MKEVFVQYAEYNLWANARLLKLVETLPEDRQQSEVMSSFSSLYKTFLHLLDAENIWWQRIKLQEKIIRPSDGFTAGFGELSKTLQQQDKLWVDWIKATNEPGLQHEFIYRNQKKERFKQPVYHVLLHMFNHSTYHRGQVVTLLRQAGVDKLPTTDFIEWSRKR